MTNPEKRNKHMTLDDRMEIQECLNKGMTFRSLTDKNGKKAEKKAKTLNFFAKTK